MVTLLTQLDHKKTAKKRLVLRKATRQVFDLDAVTGVHLTVGEKPVVRTSLWGWLLLGSLTLASLFVLFSDSFDIGREGHVPVSVPPGQAVLVLRAAPWGAVKIDGVPHGETPVMAVLSPGPHRVENHRKLDPR